MEAVKPLWVKLLAGIFLGGVFACVMGNHPDIRFKLLEGAYSYQEMKLSDGWLQRFLLYGVSSGLIFSIAAFVPKKRTIYSYMGSRTMGIYMLHGAIFKTITYCTDWYDRIRTPLEAAGVIALSFGLCLILSAKPVNRIVGEITQFPVRIFKKALCWFRV